MSRLKNQPQFGISYEFKLDVIWYKKECWFHDRDVRDGTADLLIENAGFRDLKIISRMG